MYVGTQQLVADLARRHPGVLPIAEMHYDALMSVFPLTQVPRYAQYPAGFYTYVDSYNHLSTPAPGSGSTYRPPVNSLIADPTTPSR